MVYRNRVVDAELALRLKSVGAVVVEGPKACGKTETARQIAASEVLLDVDEGARQAIAVDPSLVLVGPVPRLIDEWQVEPILWNHVRRAVDASQAPGQFVLTGSAVPADDATRHSGAGRIARLRMRPMTLFEVGRSSGDISLRALLEGSPSRAVDSGLGLEDLINEACVGGWPALRDRPVVEAMRAVRDYLNEIRRTDVSQVDGRKRDPSKIGQLMRSLARNVATYAGASTLASDTGGADGPLRDDTVRAYLDALTRLMVVEDQPAWMPHLRSKYVLRGGSKRHFVDPSLAVAAARADPDGLLRDLNYFGFLFESLVVRDLRVYAQANEAEVLQYRDSNGLEVDAVVQALDGRWAAFEIKLGQGQVEIAAANLRTFARQIDTTRSGEPAVLGVIVGSGPGYVRADGVSVIPIGSLAP